MVGSIGTNESVDPIDLILQRAPPVTVNGVVDTDPLPELPYHSPRRGRVSKSKRQFQAELSQINNSISQTNSSKSSSGDLNQSPPPINSPTRASRFHSEPISVGLDADSLTSIKFSSTNLTNPKDGFHPQESPIREQIHPVGSDPTVPIPNITPMAEVVSPGRAHSGRIRLGTRPTQSEIRESRGPHESISEAHGSINEVHGSVQSIASTSSIESSAISQSSGHWNSVPIRAHINVWRSPGAKSNAPPSPEPPEQRLSAFSTQRSIQPNPSAQPNQPVGQTQQPSPQRHQVRRVPRNPPNDPISSPIEPSPLSHTRSMPSSRTQSLQPAPNPSTEGSSRRLPTQKLERSLIDVEFSQRRLPSEPIQSNRTTPKPVRSQIRSPFASPRATATRTNPVESKEPNEPGTQSVQIRSPFTSQSTRQRTEARVNQELANDIAGSYQSQASVQAEAFQDELQTSFVESYRAQVQADLDQLEDETRTNLYPNMPDYDAMGEFEQTQAHTEFENIFETIYTLFPDANRIETDISLRQKYIIYHTYYRRIQVLQRAEAYMMIMGVAWAIMECFIERFIGNGYFMMQWQKRNKYTIALERLAEMTIPQGDGALGNPLYEIMWGCGLDLGVLVVVNILQRIFRNRAVAEQIYNILKGFLTTALQKLNAPPMLPGAPGETRAAPAPPPPESMRGQQNANATMAENTLGFLPNVVQFGRNLVNGFGNNPNPNNTASAPTTPGPTYYDN